MPAQWYDQYRKCEDGNLHEGKLELITWSCGDMGWGNCIAAESNDLQKKFVNKFGSDEQKFYEYWPQGFRWTCCGTEGDQLFGCDHHGSGSGSAPCTCDSCKPDFSGKSCGADGVVCWEWIEPFSRARSKERQPG